MKLQNILFISALMLPVVLCASEEKVTRDMVNSHLYEHRRSELTERAFWSTSSALLTGGCLYKYIPDSTGYVQASYIVVSTLAVAMAARKLVGLAHYRQRGLGRHPIVEQFMVKHNINYQQYMSLTCGLHGQVETKIKKNHPWLLYCFNE